MLPSGNAPGSKIWKFSCPYCSKGFNSEKVYNTHLALSHEAFESGDIKKESIKSLEKIKDQVHFILLKIPGARSNDKILYESVIRYFYPNFMVYDPEDQLLKPPYGRKGWTFKEWMTMPSYETCRRSRQHLQEKAKKNIKAGSSAMDDLLMLPSEKVEVQRELKELAYRRYFASG